MQNKSWDFIGVSNSNVGFYRETVDQAIKHDYSIGGVLMKDDFGYFGSGLEGYVQYNEAFKRNFDNASTHGSKPADDNPDRDKSDDFADEDLEDEDDA